MWWGAAEPGRWGTGVVCVACLVIPVLVVRLQQVWDGAGGDRSCLSRRRPEPTAATPRLDHEHGAGRALIAVYAILAIGATARALYELLDKFSQAPVAYLLSAFAAVVYCVITVALVKDTPGWRRVALVGIVVELVGVLVVGTLEPGRPGAFRRAK